MCKFAEQTAKLFGGQAEVEEISSVPPLENDAAMLLEMKEYICQICGPEKVFLLEQGGMGSEDFAVFTHRIPCAYLLLGAGTAKENGDFGKPMHNAGVVFNEDILSTGSAILAHCTFKCLENADK